MDGGGMSVYNAFIQHEWTNLQGGRGRERQIDTTLIRRTTREEPGEWLLTKGTPPPHPDPPARERGRE